LRRRRRTPTRIIKRKNIVEQQTVITETKKGTSKRVMISLSLIFLLAAISYLSYSHFFSLKMGQIATKHTTHMDTLQTDTIKTAPPPPKPVVYEQPEKKIQIEILNGCGQKGIAKIFKSILRENGFDVVNTDNYKVRGKIFWNLENSKVIDQISKISFAEKVAESLGIEDENVTSVENPSPICDVTVVIGNDYKQLKSFQEFSK